VRIDEVLQDAELTLAAKAVYILVLRHPGKGSTFEELKTACADHPNDLNTALNILRQRGYVTRMNDRYFHA
jgi:hypothetical protein